LVDDFIPFDALASTSNKKLRERARGHRAERRAR